MIPLTQRNKLESIVSDVYSKVPTTRLIITEDADSKTNPMNPVNTGFFMVNASLQSKMLVEKWYAERNHFESNHYLGTCLNQACLHEQEALRVMLSANEEILHQKVTDLITILPQTGTHSVPGINRFQRPNHFDANRSNTYYNYSNDPVDSKCQPGTDFLCQCTGLTSKGWLWGEFPNRARDLRSECLMNLIKSVH